MKIKLKIEIKEAKTFNYVLHTLEVTETNILDFLKLQSLFISPDWSTCRWEEFCNDKQIWCSPSIKNVKENSFDIEIDDYDNNVLEVLKQFLKNNELEYELDIQK